MNAPKPTLSASQIHVMKIVVNVGLSYVRPTVVRKVGVDRFWWTAFPQAKNSPFQGLQHW
jgi:hypothetical protein